MLITFLIAIKIQVSTTSIGIFKIPENYLKEREIRKRAHQISEFNRSLKQEKPSLYILAMRESARPDLGDTVPNYKAWNKFGFVGAWQINIKYMEYLEIPPFTMQEFISAPDSVFPPELQLIAVERLIQKNKHYLRDYWHFVGKKVRGIEITEDGVIFAAHLAGHRGVKNFFNYGRNPKDAYGTRLTDYLNYQKTFYYERTN